MRSLDESCRTCESYLPGLIDGISEVPFEERESSSERLIKLFRESGGPALVIPKDYSGLGASPSDAARVLRAIGSVAPSLAIATTMHHFSAATLCQLAKDPEKAGMEWALLEGISSQRLILASGFAEGRHGQGILSPTMTIVAADGGYKISGSKKPCSLSRSMDLLTASAVVPGENGQPDQLGVIIVPGTAKGISRHPFWTSNVLAGAESDEIRLNEVFVEKELVVRTEPSELSGMDELQAAGFMWFELLISSSYLGMASELVSRALKAERGSAAERAGMGVRLETATLLLNTIATHIAHGRLDNHSLADTMVARYGAQDAIIEASRLAIEMLGGMVFIKDKQVAYLAAACHCLSFHPPSRASTAASLADFMSGVDALRLD
ncbi:MAG: acyl-CoA dehydrogenase family protein [Myxococcota bacterium]